MALRRPGRFDKEIEIGVPDRNARKEILQIHSRNMPLAKDVKLDELADITHGYTGADIAALTREAAMAELRHIIPDIISKKSIPNELLMKLNVTMADFREALASIQPSALREVFVERPNVHWNDIGGLDSVKAQLKEAIETACKEPRGVREDRDKADKGDTACGRARYGQDAAREDSCN